MLSNQKIKQYFLEYGPMVLRRATYFLKNEDLAYDVQQEVFIRLMNYPKKIKEETLFSLLYRITTNICLNKIRDSKAIKVEDDFLQKIASAEDISASIEIKDLIHQLFKHEKKSTKVMAVMHYLDKLTYEEISKEVNLSVSGIKKRLRLLKEKNPSLREVFND